MQTKTRKWISGMAVGAAIALCLAAYVPVDGTRPDERRARRLKPAEDTFAFEASPTSAAGEGVRGVSACCGVWRSWTADDVAESAEPAVSDSVHEAVASCGQTGSRWGELCEPVGSPAESGPDPDQTYEDNDGYYYRRRLFRRW